MEYAALSHVDPSQTFSTDSSYCHLPHLLTPFQALGVELSTSNGQPAYPLYILAPYRLATVTLGIFVAL
jgi:hypothetical protein